MSIAAHIFTVLVKYGAGPVSAARTFTVANALIPAITSVKDSNGVEIPHNGITVDTTAILTGTPTANREVEIFDGAISKGVRPVNAQGIWTYTAGVLTAAIHTFKARALYGSGTESAVRTLTVTATTAPTISSVKGSPSGAEIPRNGSAIKGTPTADITTGVWTNCERTDHRGIQLYS